MKPIRWLERGVAASRCVFVTMLLSVALLIGCGGSPTTPSNGGAGSAGGTPPPASPLAPRLQATTLERRGATTAWVNFVERPVTFWWEAVPGATRYAVEVGTSPGAADVFSASTDGLSLTTTFGSPTQVYPRVIAYFPRTGHQASDTRVPLILLSFKDYVEALLLGTGPLAETPQSGCPAGPGRMAGWPSSALVTMTLAASLNAEQQRRASVAAGQIAEATAGVIGAPTRVSAELHPLPGLSEIVAHQADPAAPFPCSAAALGCTVPQFAGPGIYSRATVAMRGPSNLLGHETAHALYGLCHLSPAAAPISVMGGFDDGGRGLYEADIAATRAAYLAGLRGGSTRSDFVAAGVIRP